MSCSLKVERLGENSWKLLEDFSLATDKYEVTVKKGFDFDGASIPKVLWSVIGSPMEGNYVPGAVIHDGLYASQKVSKMVADNIFLDLMKQSNVGYVKRTSMYLAVKVFGGKDWKKANEYKDEYTTFVDVVTNTSNKSGVLDE